MELKKSYYAIIPAKVRYDENLSSSAKLLYGEITALANETGYCWATNEYFAKLYGVNIKSISRWIKSLIEAGYIESEMVSQKSNKGGVIRLLKIDGQFCGVGTKMSRTPVQKCTEPHDENGQYNNRMNNTINNNSSSQLFCDQKNSDTKTKRKKTFPQDSDPYLLAKYLETNIRRNCPDFPEDESRRQRWAVDMDLMIRVDKHDPDEVAAVIEWCQRDGFWRSNILSGKKLREKYLQLVLNMSRNNS